MNPFERLGLSKNASLEDAKAAFRRLAKEAHPDKNPNDLGAAARFSEIQSAYQQIKDGAASVGSAPTTKRDVAVDFQIDLATAYSGGTVSIPGSSGACQNCEGDGFVRTVVRISCPTCKGLGELRATRGIIQIKVACQDCGGTGHATKRKCSQCGGSGISRLSDASIIIPPGCADGDVFVVPNGADDANSGFHGDLKVTIRIAPHPSYDVNGSDLETTVAVPVWTAALGGKVAVPGLVGGGFTLKVPPGSQPGRRFRLKGRGMPSSAGDLVVSLVVTVPDASDGTAKAAFESLRFVMGEHSANT